MPTLDSDSFTYSNGNLATVSSAKWTKLSLTPDCVVTSNAITGTASNDCAAVITSWSGSTSNQWAQATLVTRTGDDGGPTVLSNATGTYYNVGAGSAWNLYKVIAGSYTLLAADGGAV